MSRHTTIQLYLHASRGNPIKVKDHQNGCFNIRITATDVDKKTSLPAVKDVSLKIIKGSDCITVSAKDHDQVYNENDFLIYHTTSPIDLSSIVFKVEVGTSLSGIVGYGYVSSSQLNGSSGTLMVVLVNNSSCYVGTISVDYLVAFPWQHPLNHSGTQQARCTQGISGKKRDGQPYLCGHRGAGESMNSKRPSIYPENTIGAFKMASRQKIDFVEMDVQVSKDKIPVIFHDGTAKLCLQAPLDNQSSTYIDVPIKDLTLEQMGKTKVFDVPESAAYQNVKSDDDTMDDFNLFPTLKDVFDKVPEETGLMLELKYPLQVMGDENIDYQRMDENEFVDSILQIVFDNARNRKVVLASFDANICFLCNIKQSLFPVFFITQDDTDIWTPYLDMRTKHIDTALAIAKAYNLDGLHTFSSELFKDPARIRRVLDADLILSVWGEMNEDPEKRNWLADQGVHCIQIDNVLDIKQKSEAD